MIEDAYHQILREQALKERELWMEQKAREMEKITAAKNPLGYLVAEKAPIKRESAPKTNLLLLLCGV